MENKEILNNEETLIVKLEQKTAEQTTALTTVTGGYVASALDETKKNIVDKAMPKINDKRLVDKHAKKLAENADEAIKTELETQELEIKKKDTSNKITRKEIANKLYVLKQEGKRIKKEQKHLNKQQKEEHKRANNNTYWENHGTTLEQYGLHKGSNRLFCTILLWLDGIKGFLNGIDKVSNALLKALKYVLFIGLLIGILMIIPVTREWLLKILGFVKSVKNIVTICIRALTNYCLMCKII